MVVPNKWQEEENKKLNKYLMIGGGVLALLLAALLLMAGLEVKRLDNIEAPDDSEEVMAQYYEQEEYQKLYNYMTEYQLFDEEYYDYSQAALLTNAMELQRIYLWGLQDARQEEGSAMAEEYLRNTMIYSHGILNSGYFGFPEFEGQNLELLESYKEEVRTGLKHVVHLTEEEITKIESEETWQKKELDQWMEQVMDRGLSDE